MDYYSHNLKLLEKKLENHFTLSDLNEHSFKYVGTDQGEDFFLSTNNDIYILKDQVDEESLPNPKKRELIFIVGLSTVEEIKQVISKANNNSFIVLIEPNSDWLSYTLQNKNLSFIVKNNIILWPIGLPDIPTRINELLSSTAIFLISNLRFYGSYYYRQYQTKEYLEIVKIISAGIKYKLFNLGNSIEDSLIGFEQNLNNIPYIIESKDVSLLKGAYSDVPAIVVSAGPSLDKNILYLKDAQDKALIIAVDTIVGKLIDNGITPNFMCSIERIEDVYNFFYKDKNLPKEVTLVAPPVLKSEIFKEFKGNKVIAMRYNVGEYMWMQSVLQFNNNSYISMGTSSAHLAFGFANHLGASPIILVGQDLAYGDSIEQSHSTGTIYDENKFDGLTKVTVFETPGYYGGTVKTNQVWNDFRKWFELEIIQKKLVVINATEGGSKIVNTTQLSLQEAISLYCNKELDNIFSSISNLKPYKFSSKDVITKLDQEIEDVIEVQVKSKETLERLGSFKLYPSLDNRKLGKYLDELSKTNQLFLITYNNFLLRHIMQPEILKSLWKLFKIEEVLTFENVKENFEIQTEFFEVVNFVCKKLLEVLIRTRETLATMEDQHDL